MSSHSKNNSQRDETVWDNCPAGVLVSMADRLNAAKRRKQTLRGIAATSAVLLVGAAMFAGTRSGDNMHGGISCSQCRPHLAAYQAQLKGVAVPEGEVLSPDLLEKVRLHLTKCAKCGEKFEGMYPGLLTLQSSPGELRFSAQWLAKVNQSDSVMRLRLQL
ncbi:hypothetical protein [Adhaeretor mobilis]|uniref:Zinc-finger domain-containing protein n=1 Tax=Adhaeretor mobilis TaxID=1930276 RepID=A0A517MU39_9BACT|nr:hypothetical protein [Adhaeretor mobilis]QDS98403.1 hypothetical protein HG15A2_16790 [Adhaeretor mobilis]